MVVGRFGGLPCGSFGDAPDLPKMSVADLVRLRADLLKTEFFTDDAGIVHPIRGSEGYDESQLASSHPPETTPEIKDRLRTYVGGGAVAPKPDAATGSRHLSDEKVTEVAATIRRNLDKFRAAGGTTEVLHGVPTETSPKGKLIDKVVDMQEAGVIGSKTSVPGYGADFTRSALTFPHTVVAMIGPDVAGAQGYDESSARSWGASRTSWFGADKLYGNGFVGTTGIVEGAGSAVVAAMLAEAASQGAAMDIHPVSAAEPFWAKMGMTPTAWSSYEWGMSAPDVKRLSDAIQAPAPATKVELPEPPEVPEGWDPDAAPNRERYLEWVAERDREKEGS